MMASAYKSLIFSLVIIFLSKSSVGQFNRADKCAETSPCTLLTKCPKSLAALKSRNAENIKNVQEQICGFHERKSKVCCEIEGSVNPATPPSIAGEELLPKNCGRTIPKDRIFGGAAVTIGAYPWIVALGYKVQGFKGIQFGCAGSLINDRYVLTAAHCLDPEELNKFLKTELTVLHIADWDLSNPGIDCTSTKLGPICASAKHFTAGIESTIIHPEYNKRAKTSDDIALIRMDIAVDFEQHGGSIESICLPPLNFDPIREAGNRVPVAAGWGLTENSTSSNILLSVKLPFNENSVCQEVYPNKYIDKQLCVGGIAEKDTCTGDSGGPLMMHGPTGPPFSLIGIGSYGQRECSTAQKPGVYVSVSAYRNWIVGHLRP